MRRSIPLFILSVSLTLACAVESREDLPSWVPAYPGVEAQLLSAAETDQRWSGTAMLSVAESPEEIFRFYRQALLAAGMKTDLAPIESNDEGVAQVVAYDDDETRGLTVTITPVSDGSQVIVNFTQVL